MFMAGCLSSVARRDHSHATLSLKDTNTTTRHVGFSAIAIAQSSSVARAPVPVTSQ
jgi:hypothetical protein